jgi:Ser/Thr protein kinase RdoA (MazF antagonist)
LSGSGAAAEQPRPFDALEPARILDALESAGVPVDGRLQTLNSYENRVYLAGCDDDRPRVVKFYRPGRWTDAQIQEEHDFAAELVAAEIPVCAPIASAEGRTLWHHEDLRFAIFERMRGRAPELDNRRTGPDMRDRIGQFIGRIHRVGRSARFEHRPLLLDPEDGPRAVAAVLACGLLPVELERSWTTIAEACIDACLSHWRSAAPIQTLRLHGDCHAGNLLWTSEGPGFVDLDDCRTGPAIADLWMIADAGGQERGADDDGGEATPGGDPPRTVLLEELIEGYEKFSSFDRRELALVEPLRTWRMINHCGWLAQRWRDPAFPAAFPWFEGSRYWQEQILYLREQRGLMN